MPIQICVSIQDDNTLSLLFYFSTYLMPVGYPRSFKPTNNLLGATSVNYSRIETIYIRSHIDCYRCSIIALISHLKYISFFSVINRQGLS